MSCMPVGLLMCALLSVFSNAGGRDLGLGVAANEDHLAPGCERTSLSLFKAMIAVEPAAASAVFKAFETNSVLITKNSTWSLIYFMCGLQIT